MPANQVLKSLNTLQFSINDSQGIIAPIINSTNSTRATPKETFLLLSLVTYIMPFLSAFSVSTVMNSAIDNMVGIPVQQNNILSIPAFTLPA